MLLQDRVALITGAASGIGRATAELFSRQGARVVVADINEMGGEETVANIRRDSGEAFFVKTDVGKMDSVEAMVKAALDRCGRLDIVHSNAAAFALGKATETSEADWDRTLDVCLKATWMIAHCALPPMLAQGGGAFIVTGSVQSIRGYPRHAAYQASKGGLLALTRSLAADYAPTVRVNAILPGAVETGLWEGLSHSDRVKIAQMCPLRRNGQPEDIAQAALFLASDMSAYMTGTYLVVDGGLTSIIEMPEWLRSGLSGENKSGSS
jgi:NAD(P)-dependent dehydrogenase (short-subunit alcohol dehydrogenase family)